MKLQLNDIALDLTSDGKDYQIAIGDKTVSVQILRSENGRLDLLLDGQRVTAYVDRKSVV